MGRVNVPRRIIQTVAREATVRDGRVDEISQAELERELLRSDFVNQVAGVSARAEHNVVLSDGVRELIGVGPATRCDLCGHVFGLERMVKLGGKYYCTVHECAEEVTLAGGPPIRRDNPNWPDFDAWAAVFQLTTDDGLGLEADDGELFIDRYGAGEVQRGDR